MYTIEAEDPTSLDALMLMDRLSETLAQITGSSGTSSFNVGDVRGERACFAIARTADGIAVGCGSFRPLTHDIAEVKRMYAGPGTVLLGSALLAYLETEATKQGYREFWLETRSVNERAVAFYLRNGYRRIPNYGKYIGNPDAVCFAKHLSEGEQGSEVTGSQSRHGAPETPQKFPSDGAKRSDYSGVLPRGRGGNPRP